MNPKYLNQVLALFSGSLGAQIFSLLLMPILTRLYAPEEMGIQAFFIAVVLILVVGVNGGYEMAVVLPEEEREAHSLLHIGLAICTLLSLLMELLCYVFGNVFIIYFGFPELEGWIYLLPLSLWLEGAYQILRYALNRQQAYKRLAFSRMSSTLARNLIACALGYAGWGFEGLLVAWILGQLVQLAPVLLYLFGQKELFQLQTLSYYKEKIASYRDFPFFSMPGIWLNALSKQWLYFLVPLFFLTHKEILGWYSQSDKVLALPLLLSMSMGDVFFKQATDAARISGTELRRYVKGILPTLSALAILPMLVFALAGELLFAWYFGEDYREAGKYAIYFSPIMALQFISIPLSYLADIQRKLKGFFVLNLLHAVLRGLALYAVYAWGGTLLQGMAAYILSGIFTYSLQIFYSWYICRE